jgi:predicted Zn-dependent protease
MKNRRLFLVLVCFLTAVAGILLAISRTDQEVDLESVVEIWADVVRDADRVGLTITHIPASREMEIGREIEREFTTHLRLPIRQDATLQAYVTAVGQPLVQHIQRKAIRYRFYVVDSAMINAFALPGGGIYITTGMLKFLESEAELAAILGHEISHLDLRHCIERLQYELAARKIVGKDLAMIARLGYTLIQVGFNEQQELEADAGGAILAAKAGYNPAASIATFERLARFEGGVKRKKPTLIVEELGVAIGRALEQYFATHPPPETRIRQLHLVFRRNQGSWRGNKFYIGRANYKERVARSKWQRPGEWRVWRE